MYSIRDEEGRRPSGSGDAQRVETACLRLTDELNLYSEEELCRGARGRKSGQWIITVG